MLLLARGGGRGGREEGGGGGGDKGGGGGEDGEEMREEEGRGGWRRGERLSNTAVTQLLMQTLVFMSVIDNRSYSHKSSLVPRPSVRKEEGLENIVHHTMG